ncbi:hypothetical protein FCM35_KLT07187 [Carex littledalei]|uniref:F-box domain-containing protein n=1 Tax=Carex littledalei TaxID=544730 RepID=A0A833QPV6_9POAL|nr:hypothetical protein FCM35_KLT07187 [Carex littledalei]
MRRPILKPELCISSYTNACSTEDSGRLRAVCKSWTNLSNPIKEEQVWLMYCPKRSSTCRMYNPFKEP